MQQKFVEGDWLIVATAVSTGPRTWAAQCRIIKGAMERTFPFVNGAEFDAPEKAIQAAHLCGLSAIQAK
jgi:hypothetical protein